MKHLKEILESKLKIIFLFLLLLIPNTLTAEINSKNWIKQCANEDKNCLIAITLEIVDENSNIKKTLVTAYVRIGLNSKKEKIPVFFLMLPFNTNLQKKPKIIVDETVFLNLDFTHCNTKDGCITQNTFNQKGVSLLKEGKELNIIYEDYKLKKNIQLKLPLKGFTKAYDSLTK